MSGKTLKASLIIGGGISSSFRSAMSSAQGGLKRIGDEIVRVERKQRLMAQSIQTFGRMGKNIDDMRRRYENLTRTADRLRVAQERLARATARVDRNRAARTEVGGKLRGAAMTFGAIAGAVILPTKNAAEFNRQNQLIGNTANMTRTQVAELGRTILAVSRDANQSAADVQRGIGFLVAAGLDSTRAQASIRTIGRTATASGADIEDLAKASFTLIDSLKIKPEGLQGALDILALSGKEGNVELRDMAKTLPALGSSFVALKMQGREAAATMGAALEIARKGAGDADEAANNMRNFMAKILSPETLKKARKKFGLDLYGVIQEAQRTGHNPFEAAMQSIMRATAGDQKKIGELFSDMQVQNFLRPMIQNWDEYTRIKNKALNSSAGTTDRDFASVMSTAGEQMRALRNSAGRLAITFGTVMAPALGDAAEKLTHFMDTASGFVEKHPAFVKGVVGSALALSGLRVATLGVRYALLTVQAPFLKVGQLFAKFRAAKAVVEAGGSLLRVGGILRTVGSVIAAIGGGPIAAIVAAVTVGAMVVRKYWQPIKAFFGGLWKGLSSGAAQAFGQMRAALAPLQPAFAQLGAWIGAAWRWVSKLLAPTQYASGELSRCATVGQAVGRVLVVGLRMGIAVIGAVVKSVVWLGQAIGTAAGWIVTTFGSAWGKVKSTVASAVDWIMGKIRPLLTAAEKVGGAVGAAARKLGFGSDAKAPPAIHWNTGAAGDAAPPTRLPMRPRGRAAAMQPATTGARGSAPEAAKPVVQSIADHRKYEIHLAQQPGEDARELARRLRGELAHLDAIDARSALARG